MSDTIENPNLKAFGMYLVERMNERQLSPREVSAALGYERPNVVSMFRAGDTRVPLDKAAPLADILGVDRLDMLVRVLRCYSPDLADTLEQRITQQG